MKQQNMEDLAQNIYRQRLIIEGTMKQPISAETIITYLNALAETLDMVKLTDPVTHKSDKFGWAGWMHWETSGCHMYAWEQPLFFSVDIYTCKAFEVQKAITITKQLLNPTKIVYKEW